MTDWKWANDPSEAVLPSWQQRLERMTPAERQQTLLTIERSNPAVAKKLRSLTNIPTIPGSRWEVLQWETSHLLANDLGRELQQVVSQLEANAKEQETLLQDRQREYQQQLLRVQALQAELRSSQASVISLQRTLTSLHEVLDEAMHSVS